MPNAQLDALHSHLVAQLEVGRLQSVTKIAEYVYGEPIVPKTALRWAVAGLSGVRLPTRRGKRRSRVTTEACFRAWLKAVEAAENGASPAPVAADSAAILAKFGLAS
ncbi:MAG: hypothetical protein ACK5VI_10205 [Opitutia bacterium]